MGRRVFNDSLRFAYSWKYEPLAGWSSLKFLIPVHVEIIQRSHLARNRIMRVTKITLIGVIYKENIIYV